MRFLVLIFLLFFSNSYSQVTKVKYKREATPVIKSRSSPYVGFNLETNHDFSWDDDFIIELQINSSVFNNKDKGEEWSLKVAEDSDQNRGSNVIRFFSQYKKSHHKLTTVVYAWPNGKTEKPVATTLYNIGSNVSNNIKIIRHGKTLSYLVNDSVVHKMDFPSYFLHKNTIEARFGNNATKGCHLSLRSFESLPDDVFNNPTLYSRMNPPRPQYDNFFNLKNIEKQQSTNNQQVGDSIFSLSEIDQNLPTGKSDNSKSVAVVIGNSNYEKVKDAKFAVNDARSMKNYLINSFGFREGNIIYIENASKSDFEIVFGNTNNHKGKLHNMVRPKESDVFIFYSGHGAPDFQEHKGYFVPVEADPQYINLTCYSSEVFYSNLSKIPAKSFTVVLDACFSGAELFENISPIVVKQNTKYSLKNGLVFSSSSGDEVSSWYNKKSHGMFTYYFLKALQNGNADTDKDGRITAQELQNYVSNNSYGVPYEARRQHGVTQNPQLMGIEKSKIIFTY